MKKQALILFVPLTVFLAETVSFLPCWDEICLPGNSEKTACARPENPGSCPVTKQQEDCSAKKERACSEATEPGKCNKQNDTGSNPEKDCTNNTDCSTCPVCYTFIFQPLYEWNSTGFDLSRQYHLRDIEIISSYETNVWKPPNGSDCSY